MIDKADLYRILLTFPELKTVDGPVAERLRAAGASDDDMAAWRDLVTQESSLKTMMQVIDPAARDRADL